jgi:hypothetical protein
VHSLVTRQCSFLHNHTPELNPIGWCVFRIRPVRAALFVAVSRAHKRARVSELKDGYEPGNAV